MTHVIRARNVSEALSKALDYMWYNGVWEESRIGSVVVAPGPVITEYTNPTERVLFSAVRDANPFFHFMEGLWMLNGGSDVAWPKMFNSRFAEYSLDDVTLHGAYGHRWRKAFGFDQLHTIVAGLRESPTSRRAVLQMWSAKDDLCTEQAAKDTPCNTHAYFDVRGGVLNMTVCCRSNDAIWGAYGANAVHFSMLQEVLAAMVGVGVGVYRQFSNNFHIYESVLPKEDYAALMRDILAAPFYEDGTGRITLFPMMSLSSHATAEQWLEDLAEFIAEPDMVYSREEADFFKVVARPMYRAWVLHKEGDFRSSRKWARTIQADDWRIACCEWLERRHFKGGKL